jgi:hypothetical protein
MNAFVAAAHARARRHVRRAFEEAHAFSADRAIGFEPQRRVERCFEQLREAGAIVEVRQGMYRGDRDKWDALDRARRNRALIMVGGALALGAAILGIGQL